MKQLQETIEIEFDISTIIKERRRPDYKTLIARVVFFKIAEKKGIIQKDIADYLGLHRSIIPHYNHIFINEIQGTGLQCEKIYNDLLTQYEGRELIMPTSAEAKKTAKYIKDNRKRLLNALDTAESKIQEAQEEIELIRGLILEYS